MNFLQEDESRRFFIWISFFSVFLILFAILISLVHVSELQSMMFEREKAIASSLLSQGISKTEIAKALSQTQITTDGTELLRQIGHTKSTFFLLFPFIKKSAVLFGSICVCIVLIFSVFLLLLSKSFLQKREALYENATKIIAEFSEGNFKTLLPDAKTGALYQMFHSVEELAMALRAENENTIKNKEFLKNTISDISHQLKTPLAALNMYMEIITEEPDNIETVKTFSNKAIQSLERMEQLIQSMLKVTRIDAGSIKFQKNIYPVMELIEKSIENLTTRAKSEGKDIVIKGNPDDTVFCDLSWTSEAIGNIVKNALDHTTTGGIISIEYQYSPALFRMTISDNGCGIAPEDIHHIFKRFYRSKNSIDTQGVGLGLSLSKAIIEGQNGNISVSSTYGKGTVFTISFLTNL